MNLPFRLEVCANAGGRQGSSTLRSSLFRFLAIWPLALVLAWMEGQENLRYPADSVSPMERRLVAEGFAFDGSR
jgi:hypothetical protein